MKKFALLFILLLTTATSCNSWDEKELPQSSFISDNAELEEAKAITRKLFEGLKKVEEDQMTREAFEEFAEPLQHKLNSLIISMEDRDAKKLESYKNELMLEMIENDSGK